ncbi:cytochrome c-555 [bacterium BMS3Bbin11]|nr:cytochrome c-555 [bacterium BMS3Abin11]GBE44968.1 cytochrome c-555 [bacterium BMS3Bbin11]
MVTNMNVSKTLKYQINLLSIYLIVLLTLALSASVQAAGNSGKRIVEKNCAACHQTGVAGAPKTGVKADWDERLKQGDDTLNKHAIEGFKGMPPKGGNRALTTKQVKDAVAYMHQTVVGSASKKTSRKKAAVASKPVVKKSAPKKTVSKPKVATVNTFNRLMIPKNKRNPPPMRDGIHDPKNSGTKILQHPSQAFNGIAKSRSGNYIDWVKALNNGNINPRYKLLDENAKPLILDLNIIREVKGSMPNVDYPHKQHTQWLDCSNCHPAIFIPKKGGNQISMAAILLGRKCGVCHGKVSFPVSDCRRCHSRKKNAKIIKKTSSK